jgi:hypothetical protein
VRKLYDDYDSESGISEKEYAEMVDDIMNYDLQLRTRKMAEKNYSQIEYVLENNLLSNKKTKRRLAYIQGKVRESLDENPSIGYLENMLNSCLARLAKYRKSRSVEMLPILDQNFIEMFEEFCELQESQVSFQV